MLKCHKCGGELTEEDGFFVCHACNSKFLAKKKSDASNQNDDGDNLKCPDCNSTPSPESANAGQEKNGDAQQSELDLLKARLAELEKKQEKVAKQSESSAKIKEKS